MDDEELMRILEAGGWNPCTEFEKVPHYNNVVHCGDPANYGDVDVEEVMISKTLIRYGTNFTVDAHGDSMIGAGIWDGCTLMIRRQQVAEVGDIVLALIDSDEMTVKSYMEDEDGVAWLVPCNDKYDPMCMRDYPNTKIIGKVVNIERKNPRAPYNDCMKRVREAQKDKPRKREYTAEQLRNALHTVMEVGLKNRHWYAIYRVMVDESIIDDGDYEGFQAVLFNVLGDEAPNLNLKDLSSNMAIGSFRKRLNEWDPENAPVTGKRFYAYLNVGKEFKRCLK